MLKAPTSSKPSAVVMMRPLKMVAITHTMRRADPSASQSIKTITPTVAEAMGFMAIEFHIIQQRPLVRSQHGNDGFTGRCREEILGLTPTRLRPVVLSFFRAHFKAKGGCAGSLENVRANGHAWTVTVKLQVGPSRSTDLGRFELERRERCLMDDQRFLKDTQPNSVSVQDSQDLIFDRERQAPTGEKICHQHIHSCRQVRRHTALQLGSTLCLRMG